MTFNPRVRPTRPRFSFLTPSDTPYNAPIINRSQVTTVGSSGNVDSSGLEPIAQAFFSTDDVVMAKVIYLWICI